MSCECTRQVCHRGTTPGTGIGGYTYCMNCGPEIVSGHEALRALAEEESGDI